MLSSDKLIVVKTCKYLVNERHPHLAIPRRVFHSKAEGLKLLEQTCRLNNDLMFIHREAQNNSGDWALLQSRLTRRLTLDMIVQPQMIDQREFRSPVDGFA
jgi:hypothetical protein